MKKILLITNADMAGQAGNVVLVTRRAEELYKLYGVVTTCVVVRPGYDAADIRHRIEGIEFSAVGSRRGLDAFLTSGDYGTVIIYGELLVRHVGYIKKKLPGATVLLDKQGSFEEQIEYSPPAQKPLNYLKYYIKKYLFRGAVNRADGIIVVTDILAEYDMKFVRKKNHNRMKTYKIRCGVTEILTAGRRFEYRRDVRAKWAVRDETVVMVYSGHRLKWQKLDDIIAYFKQIDRTGADVFFAFFCDSDEAFASRLRRDFPRGNYVLDYLSFGDYFRYLCACDVGFLIRDYNLVNKVAFPNKFSDYLNAGLLLALSNAVPEPAGILRDNGVDHIDVDEPLSPEDVLAVCARRQGRLADYYALCDTVCEKELLMKNQIIRSKIVEAIDGR